MKKEMGRIEKPYYSLGTTYNLDVNSSSEIPACLSIPANVPVFNSL
jgi:hypothetical protein